MKWTKDMNKCFTKEENVWKISTWQKCLVPSAIWEMLIKITMSSCYISIRMARVKTADSTKCLEGCKKWLFHTLLLYECKILQLLWKIVTTYFKLNMHISGNISIAHLEFYPREIKWYFLEKYVHARPWQFLRDFQTWNWSSVCEWIHTNCGTFITWNTAHQWKEWTLDTCNNLAKPPKITVTWKHHLNRLCAIYITSHIPKL